MDKLTRTIITYLSSIALQILCFYKGKNSVMEYNASVIKHNESIQKPTWFSRIFRGEISEPMKEKIDPTSEWFAIDKWDSFNLSYYDTAELTTYIILFTITALFYLFFSGRKMKKEFPLLRLIPFILSLVCGYVILYEIKTFY